MDVQKLSIYWILVLTGILVLSCSERKPNVQITQYTDPTPITAIIKYNDMVYNATKGGLIQWKLPEGDYTILTTADGLPSNNLSDLLIDSENRLWVSSDSGISVFDGSSWKRYGMSDGLPSGEVTELSIDNHGTVWVGTIKGMARFNRGRFEEFNEENGPVGLNIACIYFDRGDNTWVGTPDKGVFIKMKDTWYRSGSKNGLVTDAASTIIQTWDNSIWAASWAGIARYDGFGWQAFKPMKRLGTFNVRQLGSTKERLWYFTANGVHASRGSDWLHYTEDEGLISNDVTCGYLVSDELVYVGTAYGMSVIDKGTIENYSVPNTQFGNNCISISVDNKKRVWVGTWESGLNVYDSGYWCRITGPNETMLATVRDIVFPSDDRVVFNTKEGVVFKDSKNWEVYTRQNGISSDDVRCGVYDASGTFWAGTSTGISAFSKGQWTRYRAVHGLPSEDIWTCALDSEGTVWFGTSGGIVSISGDTITDRSPEVGVDDLDVRSIGIVGATMYFGTESGKIITYTKGTWDIYGNKFLRTDKGIYSIASDPSGILWIGTNGDGIIRVENGKTAKYTMKDGLPSNFVRDIAWSDGVVWAACYGGVATIEQPGQ